MIWDKLVEIQKNIESELDATGKEIQEDGMDQFNRPGWVNRIWTSNDYRRAHVDVVDARETKKLLFRSLAETGDAKSQFNLGVMYENGHGVAQDNAAAIKWYRRAAKAGHAEAQYNLGVMYDNGQGVPQNYAEAMSWYRRAAETGHAKAQNNLGFLYSNGKGVPQDYITAHMWANLAASNSNDLSTGLRAIIASEMSPAEIERAQARAAQCLASNYQDCGG